MHGFNVKYIILIVLSLSIILGCRDDNSNVIDISKTVYIDPTVSASGDGTEAKPYKYWSEVTFRSGYSYLQKRGTVAREEIAVNVSGTGEKPVILGAYGTGERPVVQGSELESGWTLAAGSIYYKQFDNSCSLGMAAEDGSVLTFLKWDTNFTTTFSGASAGSYSVDHYTNTVYVWCSSGTPDSHQLEISRRMRGIIVEGVNYVTISELNVRYASLHGIDAGSCGITGECIGGEISSNIVIQNCEVTGCGGAWFGPPYNLHLGNGIQFANGVTGCRVENCIITDIFDSGFTPQVYSDGYSQSGIVISGTSIARCGFAGIEIAALNNGGSAGTISDVTVEKVDVSDSGKGWSGDRSDEYPEVQAVGIKISCDDGSDISDVKIEQSSVTGCIGNAVWIYGDAGTVIINRSKIFSNDSNGVAAADNRTGLTLKLAVTSSLIYNNGGYGIYFYVTDGEGYEIYNNTFYNNSIGIAVFGNNGTAIVKNNIFSMPVVAHIYCQDPGAGTIYDYNCYHGSGSEFIGYDGTSYSTVAGFREATVHEDNGIQADPEFFSASSGDFSLVSGSQCIGKGDSTVGVSLDYWGNMYKITPAIGACEYY